MFLLSAVKNYLALENIVTRSVLFGFKTQSTVQAWDFQKRHNCIRCLIFSMLNENCVENKMNRPFSKYQITILLDSEAVRTKGIETRWSECEKYLHIIHFPLSLSSMPHYQAEF